MRGEADLVVAAELHGHARRETTLMQAGASLLPEELRTVAAACGVCP
jgi:hypothetical protein